MGKSLADLYTMTDKQVKWLIERAGGDDASKDDEDVDIDTTPAEYHTSTKKNPGKEGDANSSVDIL